MLYLRFYDRELIKITVSNCFKFGPRVKRQNNNKEQKTIRFKDLKISARGN